MEMNAMEALTNYHEERPWGSFTILAEGSTYKVKTITVLPGKRLSYQKHARRSEYWTIVQGAGIFTLDGANQSVEVGDRVEVPLRAAHRIQNPGTESLVFIEVQLGDYFGEDDIVRLEDDFGRTN